MSCIFIQFLHACIRLHQRHISRMLSSTSTSAAVHTAGRVIFPANFFPAFFIQQQQHIINNYNNRSIERGKMKIKLKNFHQTTWKDGNLLAVNNFVLHLKKSPFLYFFTLQTVGNKFN